MPNSLEDDRPLMMSAPVLCQRGLNVCEDVPAIVTVTTQLSKAGNNTA